jgi:hypothetical protein
VLVSLPDDSSYLAGADGWDGTPAYLASGKAALVQHVETTKYGIDLDMVDIHDPSILWFPKAPAPVLQPVPAPVAVVAIPSALEMQHALNAAGATLVEDGDWGAFSAAALAAYYRR